jgi:hypothetical protein
LKQSTAADVILGPFVDSTDGVTAETALTISQADIRLSKNGAAYAQTNNATGATHRENGNYLIPLDSTDTNTLGRLRVSVAESGALPCWLDFSVVPANVWDSMFSTDLLQVDVTQWLGTAASTPTVAGVPNVNVKTWNDLTTVALPLVPTTAGRTLDVSTGGEAGIDWNNVGSPTTTLALTGTSISTAQAVASVSGNVGGNVTGSVGSVATGGITSASFASGAITSTVIAADAIGASELAADAVAEIADQVWDELLSGHSGAGSAGLALSTASSGGVDPSVLADAIWDEATSGHSTAGTYGKAVSDILVDTAEIGAAGAGLTALATAAALATVDTVVDSILVDTAEIGAAGAGLTALASAANLAIIDDFLDTEIAAIKAKTDSLTFTGDDVHAFVHQMVANVITAGTITTDAIGADEISAAAVTKIQAGLSTLTTSQVNAEVVDVLATDTYAEPAQGAPAATATLAAKLNWMYKFLRNKITQTSTTLSVYDDAGTTVDHKATVSDDGTTYTRGEIASGP